MIKKEYPILEFDDDRNAFINPKNALSQKNLFGSKLVICYFKEVIARLIQENKIILVETLDSECTQMDIYKYVDYDCFITLGHLGAPAIAGFLEELIEIGFKDIICCGGAGVLRKDIAVGHLIIPSFAIRDEGLSYHYLSPSRTVKTNELLLNHIVTSCDKLKIPYIVGGTWTTDAFYRETKEKIKLRKEEMAVCVEMEQAALMAVAEFRGVNYGAILYGGDDLSGAEWDNREWKSRSEIRYNLCNLTRDIIVNFNGEQRKCEN